VLSTNRLIQGGVEIHSLDNVYGGYNPFRYRNIIPLCTELVYKVRNGLRT